jgi:hypothetical protein
MNAAWSYVRVRTCIESAVVVTGVVLMGLSATAPMLTPVDSGPLRMLCCDWNQYATAHHFKTLVSILLVRRDGQR